LFVEDIGVDNVKRRLGHTALFIRLHVGYSFLGCVVAALVQSLYRQHEIFFIRNAAMIDRLMKFQNSGPKNHTNFLPDSLILYSTLRNLIFLEKSQKNLNF
jgi:hypothetical protein